MTSFRTSSRSSGEAWRLAEGSKEKSLIAKPLEEAQSNPRNLVPSSLIGTVYVKLLMSCDPLERNPLSLIERRCIHRSDSTITLWLSRLKLTSDARLANCT